MSGVQTAKLSTPSTPASTTSTAAAPKPAPVTSTGMGASTAATAMAAAAAPKPTSAIGTAASASIAAAAPNPTSAIGTVAGASTLNAKATSSPLSPSTAASSGPSVSSATQPATTATSPASTRAAQLPTLAASVAPQAEVAPSQPQAVARAPPSNAVVLASDNAAHHSNAFYLIAALVLCAAVAYGLYEYYRSSQEPPKAPKAAVPLPKPAASKPKPKPKPVEKHAAPKLTPMEERSRLEALYNCRRHNFSNSGCEYDEEKKRWYLECKRPYYGVGCTKVCKSSTDEPRTYTKGGDDRAPTQASCECPVENHFSNRDIANGGCKAGTSISDTQNCQQGWIGKLCDTQGAFKNCGKNAVTQVGNTCVCKVGWTGPQCQYNAAQCNTLDKAATMNTTDGSCTCSVGYVSEPNTSGPNARCNLCDAANGYYEKDGACVAGTVCELIVNGANGAATPSLQNDAGQSKTFDMSTYGTTGVSTVQLKRLKGTGACTARLQVSKPTGCHLDITLPEGKRELVSYPLEPDTKGGKTGRSVTSVTVGATSDVVSAGGTAGCASGFDTDEDDNCPSGSGNVCRFYWS